MVVLLTLNADPRMSENESTTSLQSQRCSSFNMFYSIVHHCISSDGYIYISHRGSLVYPPPPATDGVCNRHGNIINNDKG